MARVDNRPNHAPSLPRNRPVNATISANRRFSVSGIRNPTAQRKSDFGPCRPQIFAQNPTQSSPRKRKVRFHPHFCLSYKNKLEARFTGHSRSRRSPTTFSASSIYLGKRPSSGRREVGRSARRRQPRRAVERGQRAPKAGTLQHDIAVGDLPWLLRPESVRFAT